MMSNLRSRVNDFYKVPNKSYVVWRYLHRLLGLELWQKYSKNELKARISSVDLVKNHNEIIIFCVSQNKNNPGGYASNGGIKLLNLWVKLLRQHKYEAYIVTHDGKYVKWLINHQPHISISALKKLKRQGKSITYVTTWLQSDEYIEIADKIYYFDAELAFTSGEHYQLLTNYLQNGKIQKIGTHSKTQVGWYLQQMQINPSYIKEWSDEEIWKPNKSKRKKFSIGYMIEDSETLLEIAEIKDISKSAGYALEFIHITGTEKEVLSAMQSCAFYLGMNSGKDRIWGEGCPRSQQEAMHAGCIVIAYDVIGNRELIEDGVNGYLVDRKRSDLMAKKLLELIRNNSLAARIRRNSEFYADSHLSSEGRLSQVLKFLDLDQNQHYFAENLEELEYLIKAPVFLTSPEVRALASFAKKSTASIVEIGAAYGASSSILRSHAKMSIPVHSIDPFIQDSMGTFSASSSKCLKNVKRVHSKLNQSEKLAAWYLHTDYSFNFIKKWQDPIGMIFIDGDHEYQAVKRDFDDWFPHVIKGGYVLIHDSCHQPGTKLSEYNRGWPGPTKLAYELKQRKDIVLLGEVSSLSIWQKK